MSESTWTGEPWKEPVTFTVSHQRDFRGLRVYVERLENEIWHTNNLVHQLLDDVQMLKLQLRSTPRKNARFLWASGDPLLKGDKSGEDRKFHAVEED